MSIPSPSHGKATSGLLFRHASTWVRTVEYSSKVSFTLAVTRFRWYFMLFTADSQSTPKRGAFSGMNFHSMCYIVQNSEMWSCTCWWFRNCSNSLRSFFAPTKLVPWSLQITLGFPRLAMNLLKAATKASDVKSETSSRCTALTNNETNKYMTSRLWAFTHTHTWCTQVRHSLHQRFRTLYQELLFQLGVAPSAGVLASQIDGGKQHNYEWLNVWTCVRQLCDTRNWERNWGR